MDELPNTLNSLRLTGIGGLECHYPWHNDEFTSICVDFCKENDLCITCGGDGHGEYGRQEMIDWFGVDYYIGVKKVDVSLLDLKDIFL